MLIGVPSEIKNHEYRVGLTPDVVHSLVAQGHEVIVQRGAGAPIGFYDELYEQSGAHLVNSAKEVYQAELIIKVKEPQPSEYKLFHEGQTLFTFLHLAVEPELTQALLEAGVIAIAYETITNAKGHLPLLTPMSDIAGKVAVHAAAYHLQMAQGGRGILLGRVPGVPPAKVAIIGGGIVGTSAARMAMGLEAEVTIIDRNVARLRKLEEMFGIELRTRFSTPQAIEQEVIDADVVIGAVLLPGKQAPKLITKEHVSRMRPGSVIVDVAIDQGGCCETSQPTTHTDPIFEIGGVVHYCVTNMPGACARTATLALLNVSSPFVFALANKGVRQALIDDPFLREGINIYLGHVTNKGVAEDLNHVFYPPETFLGEEES